MAFGFVRTLASMNFELGEHFTEARRCVRFWLDSVRQCDAACSCEPGRVCCRDTALRSLEATVGTLKDHVKFSFTPYSSLQFASDYHSTTFQVQGAFSSFFKDFIAALQRSRTKAVQEIDHYTAYFRHLRRKRPLQGLFRHTAANASVSLIDRVAGHYDCSTERVLPFYLNVYGTVLQYVLMLEVYEELQRRDGPGESQFAEIPEWKQYLRLTSDMTGTIVACSSKKIFAIRSQEIKEKDVAMRNAAIVFSFFLLLLVLIIALVVVLACRTRRRGSDAGSIVVHDRPPPASDESDNRDLLYKRYYEMDDAV